MERQAPVPDAVLNQFAPEGILSAAEVEAATRRFKQALLERVLGAELSHHLGQEAETASTEAPPNHRNGTSAKTVLTDDGVLPFAPVLIPKHQRRFAGFDDKILALYARGLTVRDIPAFLHEMYAVEVFDALRVKMRDEAVVQNKAVYLALAILPDGSRDILIAVTDGLKGLPEALDAVFPQTTLQTFVVHLLRHSLAYAGWKERKAFAAALRPIYTAASADAAEAALTAAEAGPWGRAFPRSSPRGVVPGCTSFRF